MAIALSLLTTLLSSLDLCALAAKHSESHHEGVKPVQATIKMKAAGGCKAISRRHLSNEDIAFSVSTLGFFG